MGLVRQPALPPASPVVAPRDAGIVDKVDPDKIQAALEGLVNSGKLVGVSGLVYHDGRQVFFGAYGMADREHNVPMTRDTRVRLFSMTKPVIGVALMTLYEQGKFKLGDPLSKYLPEFANVTVYAGTGKDGHVVTEPLKRPITMLDVMRHTTGLHSGDTSIPALDALFKAADPLNRNNTLEEMGKRLASVPLRYQPGERWWYSPATDIQALLVQKFSGMKLDDYLQKAIFTPLGMAHTGRYVPDAASGGLAALYQRHDDGTFSRVPDDDADSDNSQKWPLTRGSTGLTATIDDYMRLARMLLNEGELDGVRILQPKTVRLMSTNWLPAGITSREWLPSKGRVGFGLDFAVRTAPPEGDEAAGEMNEFFWDGFANTLFWVDPLNRIAAVLFAQFVPFGHVPLHRNFRDAVYGITPPSDAPSSEIHQ